ncbi:MAG: hypothetical protein RLZZ359_738 [Actinomycetota bacterium]|jgi:hypothetical protein
MNADQSKKPKALLAIIGIVGLEGLVVLGLAGVLLVEILAGASRSLTTALALFAMVAAAGAFVAFIAVSLYRGKRWARSAALFWQLVQLAVASASFSGEFANWMIGTALIVPSVSVLALIFRKSVVAATMEQVDRD